MGTRRITAGLLLFVVALSLVAVVRTDENEYRLIRDLMAGYDKRVRPSNNYTESLNVTFGMALAQIIDVDMKNQILTTNCWLNQIWTDVGLQWDPDKYGGIQVIRLPYDEIWRPDILLYNNADVSAHFSSISSNVIVTSDGNVTWLSMVIFKSSCPINVRYFPFDWQNCSMLFASWTYDGLRVNLVMNSPIGDTSNYIANSEWQLVAMRVERNVRYYSCCKEPYPDITFEILFKRRPLFYIFNMVLPCILITLVALLGFYIPSDSGEKVTMGITTLLSMTVFMMLVTENMPPTSDELPLIGIYYGMTIFIVSFATGMTVFTLNIHHKGERGREVPAFIKMICFRFLARFFCIRVESSSLSDDAVFTPECNGAAGSSAYIRYRRTPPGQTCDPDMSQATECKSEMEHSVGMSSTGSRVDIQLNRDSTHHHHHLHHQTAACRHAPVTSPSHHHHQHHQQHYLHSTPGGATDYVPTTTTTTTTTTTATLPQHVYQPVGTPSHPCFPPPPPPPQSLGSGSGPPLCGAVPCDQHHSGMESQFSRVLHKVCQTIERNEIRLREQDKRDVIKLEWQQVAQIADRVLLLCFVTATVTITGVVLFQSPGEMKV